jgi:hypothetical protein
MRVSLNRHHDEGVQANIALEPTARRQLVMRRGSARALDSRIAATRQNLEIGWGEARSLGNSRQHPWPDLFVIVKGEDEIRPTGTFECSMRAGLPLDLPTDPKEGG